MPAAPTTPWWLFFSEASHGKGPACLSTGSIGATSSTLATRSVELEYADESGVHPWDRQLICALHRSCRAGSMNIQYLAWLPTPQTTALGTPTGQLRPFGSARFDYPFKAWLGTSLVTTSSSSTPKRTRHNAACATVGLYPLGYLTNEGVVAARGCYYWTGPGGNEKTHGWVACVGGGWASCLAVGGSPDQTVSRADFLPLRCRTHFGDRRHLRREGYGEQDLSGTYASAVEGSINMPWAAVIKVLGLEQIPGGQSSPTMF